MDKATEAPPETQNQSWSSPEFEKEFYSALGKDRPEDVPPEFRPGQDPAVKPEDKATPEVKPETAPKTDTPEKIEEEDTETPESLKSGKAAEDWKRMRAAHKDEAAKLKARIKELESASKPVKTEAPPDYEQIKK
jgi:hypothetical protein